MEVRRGQFLVIFVFFKFSFFRVGEILAKSAIFGKEIFVCFFVRSSIRLAKSGEFFGFWCFRKK